MALPNAHPLPLGGLIGWRGVAAAALLLYLVGTPLLLAERSYILTVIVTASLLAVAALGVWLTFAIGRINIAQGGFMLIGAYVSAIGTSQYGLSFWATLPLAAAATGAVGYVIGLAILRLRGVYFAMLSLSLAEAIRLAAQSAEPVTNGSRGLVGLPLPGPISIAGLELTGAFTPGDRVAFFLFATILLIAAYAAVRRIHGLPFGATLRAIRQSEELAESTGIDVTRTRAVAFAIACALGGLSGAGFAAVQQNVYPSTYGVTDGVYLMMYCFIGGLVHPFGAIFGTFVLVIGFEILREAGALQSLLFAVLMITAILVAPNGLFTLLRDRWPGPSGRTG